MGQAIIPTCFRRCQDIAVRLKFLFVFVLQRYDCQDLEAGKVP